MKVIIELDNDVFKGIKENNFDFARGVVRCFQATIADAIRNGKFIPDNATNGDMIKTMFPNAEIDPDPYKPSVDVYMGGILIMRIDRNLWNAPYKKGAEE